MKVDKMNKEELELLSYADIAYLILKETKKTMNTPILFRKICDLLELSESAYTSKIGNFYTSLTIDKRFVLLENAEWDLRDNHPVEMILPKDEDEDLEEEVEKETEDDVEDDEELINDDYDPLLEEEEIEDEDEDLDDLSIISDEEIE